MNPSFLSRISFAVSIKITPQIIRKLLYHCWKGPIRMPSSTEKQETILLFVYGTLRPATLKGRQEVTRLDGTHYGAGTTKGKLYNIGWFPGAIFTPEVPSVIVGDILELPATALTHLDQYEGCRFPNVPGNLYNRVRIMVARERENEEVECWAYEYNNARNLQKQPLIPSGDWLHETVEGV